jgi:hypothetical protein
MRTKQQAAAVHKPGTNSLMKEERRRGRGRREEGREGRRRENKQQTQPVGSPFFLNAPG